MRVIRSTASRYYRVVFGTLTPIQLASAHGGEGTLAKLLGTDLPLLPPLYFTIVPRLHHHCLTEVVSRQRPLSPKQYSHLLLRTLTAVSVGAYLRAISLLYKPGACGHYQVTERPRDW